MVKFIEESYELPQDALGDEGTSMVYVEFISDKIELKTYKKTRLNSRDGGPKIVRQHDEGDDFYRMKGTWIMVTLASFPYSSPHRLPLGFASGNTVTLASFPYKELRNYGDTCFISL